MELFNCKELFTEALLPGDKPTVIQYYALTLLWKPLGAVVQFVLVNHPGKGRAIFLATDLKWAPLEVIKLYELRFKIEVTFKQAIHQIGTFMYRFWLKCMRHTKRGSGEWCLQFAERAFKLKVANKIHAYHLFILLGLIAQGLMQYLSIYHVELVWKRFGLWLRTIRDHIPPSEKVVSLAIR